MRHVFWRDEVRALSIALAGDSIPAMLHVLHGEGHPALWYLLLRGAHAIVPVREVLPASGFILAAVAMAILVLRSPFRAATIALVLFGAFGLYEYAAVARNYGIAMLALFALAALYPRWRDRGIVVGLVLALLCNTNVPSALLAAAFLLFWLIELISEEGLRWNRKYALFLVNAGLAAAGAVICFLTVYPPVHDLAPIRFPNGIDARIVTKALFAFASSFKDCMPPFLRATVVGGVLVTLLIVGSVASLIRSPAGFVSGLAALLAFELFFQLVYPGYYRHEALLLVYLLILHWLVAQGRGGRWPDRWRMEDRCGRVADIGTAMFLTLLAIQVVTSAWLVAADLRGIPYSRSRNLAALLAREHLNDAVLIADADVVLEPMPYYVRNPIYLMRTQIFGHVVRFTIQSRLHLTLDDYLRDGWMLQRRTGRPVVMVFQYRIDARPPPFQAKESHFWTLTGTPEQVRRFQAETRRIARFAPAVTDESYDVYLLNPPSGAPSAKAG